MKYPPSSELARQALENMDDSEIAMQLFEEIGTRSEVIEYILANCPNTVDFLAHQERDYWDIVETDHAAEAAWRMGRA